MSTSPRPAKTWTVNVTPVSFEPNSITDAHVGDTIEFRLVRDMRPRTVSLTNQNGIVFPSSSLTLDSGHPSVSLSIRNCGRGTFSTNILDRDDTGGGGTMTGTLDVGPTDPADDKPGNGPKKNKKKTSSPRTAAATRR